MDKKVLTIIGCIVFIVLIGFITYKLVNKDSKPNVVKTELDKLKEKKVDKNKLVSIHYSNSGNIRGNIYYIDLDIDSMIISEQKSDSHNEDINVKEYKVTEEDINKIKEEIDKYNFPAWYDLPMSDMIIYDAPSQSISFNYDNKKYTVYFDRKMENDTKKVLINFRDYYKSLIKEENKVNEYTKKREV